MLSQRSVENLDEIAIYPATELMLSEARRQDGFARIKKETKQYAKKLRVKIMHEAFQIDYTAKLLRRLFDLFDLRLNPVRSLRIALFPQFFCILLRLFFDDADAAFRDCVKNTAFR